MKHYTSYREQRISQHESLLLHQPQHPSTGPAPVRKTNHFCPLTVLSCPSRVTSSLNINICPSLLFYNVRYKYKPKQLKTHFKWNLNLEFRIKLFIYSFLNEGQREILQMIDTDLNPFMMNCWGLWLSLLDTLPQWHTSN